MFIGHDLGTSGNKAVLVDAGGRILATAIAAYPLRHPTPDQVEQDPEEWWRAVAQTTRAVVARAGVAPGAVRGLAFAGQMLALAPLDAAGVPTRPAISWLDARGEAQARRMTRRLGGERVVAGIAGAAPSGKDWVAKIAWLRRHEPAVFDRTAAFCDATGYLVARATGRLRMDPTAAGGTGVFLPGRRRWSTLLAALTGFPLNKMPTVIASTAEVGGLRPEAAAELGLAAATPVAMGMADIPAAAVGCGAVRPGDAHLYLGTSAWIGVTVRSPKSVPRAGVASVPAADSRHCLMIGESETAGACRDWLARVLTPVGDQPLSPEAFDRLAAAAPAGAAGVLHGPWLAGERSPIPDEALRGVFLNLGLEHGRAELARAVLEGVARNLTWTLNAIAKVGEPCTSLRAIGGGAQSDLWLQIIADSTQRPIARVSEPLFAGARGAALIAAVSRGELADVAAIAECVRTERAFVPQLPAGSELAPAAVALRALLPALSTFGRRLRRM